MIVVEGGASLPSELEVFFFLRVKMLTQKKSSGFDVRDEVFEGHTVNVTMRWGKFTTDKITIHTVLHGDDRRNVNFLNVPSWPAMTSEDPAQQ